MSDDIVTPTEFPEPTRSEKGGNVGDQSVAAVPEKRKSILEQKQFVTGRISETVRYVGFGLLVIFYAFASADTGFPKFVFDQYNVIAKMMAIFAFAAVFLDYLQYVFGSWAVEAALNEQGVNANSYNKQWFSYRARGWCYKFKQVFLLIACLMLLFVMLRTL